MQEQEKENSTLRKEIADLRRELQEDRAKTEQGAVGGKCAGTWFRSRASESQGNSTIHYYAEYPSH